MLEFCSESWRELGRRSVDTLGFALGRSGGVTVSPPKQLHQDLQSSLASHFCGQIQDLIGWISRYKQEMEEVVEDFFSFLSRRGSAKRLEMKMVSWSKLKFLVKVRKLGKSNFD